MCCKSRTWRFISAAELPITQSKERGNMTARVKVLKQLIRESLYVIDAHPVADAIVLRMHARDTLPELSLRSDARGPQIRSFRRHDAARSFRLTGAPRLRSASH
jgi:hypothetical protein